MGYTPFYNSIEHLIRLERAGLSPQFEGVLRERLQRMGISFHPDIVFGAAVPLLERQKRQYLGMEPDSENNVDNQLSRIGLRPISRPTPYNAG